MNPPNRRQPPPPPKRAASTPEKTWVGVPDFTFNNSVMMSEVRREGGGGGTVRASLHPQALAAGPSQPSSLGLGSLANVYPKWRKDLKSLQKLSLAERANMWAKIAETDDFDSNAGVQPFLRREDANASVFELSFDSDKDRSRTIMMDDKDTEFEADLPEFLKIAREILQLKNRLRGILLTQLVPAVVEACFETQVNPEIFDQMKERVDNLYAFLERLMGDEDREIVMKLILSINSNKPMEDNRMFCSIKDKEKFVESVESIGSHLKKLREFVDHPEEMVETHDLLQDLAKQTEDFSAQLDLALKNVKKLEKTIAVLESVVRDKNAVILEEDPYETAYMMSKFY